MENLNVAMCMEIHVWLNGLNVFKPFWQLLSAACNSARRLVVKTSYFPFRRDNAFGRAFIDSNGRHCNSNKVEKVKVFIQP